MRLTEVAYGTAQPVESYGPGFFRIGGKVLRGPTLITAQQAGPWGGLEDVAALTALAGEVDVIFLGMGAEIAHPPRALREALEQAGMGVEVCASPAACRTYNVLLSEGRRVALALLPV